MRVVAAVVLLIGVAGCLATNDVRLRDAEACSPDTQPHVIQIPAGSVGWFTSSNYPSDYDNNADCRWLLVAQPGYVVSLEFTAFNTEPDDFDVLWIRDGDSATSNHIMGLDGPRQAPLTKIYSSDVNLFLQFTSDGLIPDTGFNVSYTNVDPATVQDACSGHRPLVVTDSAGEFTSKFYPDLYPNGVSCQLLIENQEPGGTVQIDFSYFNTEAGWDHVWIFDGDSTGAAMLAQLSGSYTTAPTGIRSTQSFILLSFVSDETIIGPGFVGTWTAIPAA